MLVVVIWRYYTVTQEASLRNSAVIVPSQKKHYDGTVENLTDNFCITHIIQNSSYGELIMFICSTALKKKVNF